MDRNAWNRYQKGGSWHYDVVAPGFKYNMTDIAAALGLCQLELLPQMQETRERYAAIYDEAFSRLNAINLQRQVPNGKNARHLYYIRVQEEQTDHSTGMNLSRSSALTILAPVSILFPSICIHIIKSIWAPRKETTPRRSIFTAKSSRYRYIHQ